MFKKISHLDKMLFAKHLSLMIKSGLPIREGIETVKAQTTSSFFKKVLKSVGKDLENGKSLSDSILKYSDSFGSFFINIIKIGESSGTLGKNLEYLSEYLKKSYAIRKKVIGAMIYPALILISTLALGISLSVFIMPKLIPLFEGLNVDLPITTKALLFSVNFLQAYWLYMIISSVALFFLTMFAFRFPFFRYIWSAFVIKMPVSGSIIKNLNMSLTSRTLGLLLESGVPVLRALDITSDTTSNLVYKKSIKQMSKLIESGKSMHEHLKERDDIYSQSFIKMISVGERTGNLETSLLYLADFYEGEVDNSTKQLSTILEPLLLVFIGLIVGFIAISIITPIYDITSGFER